MEKQYRYFRDAPNPCQTCGKRFKARDSNAKRQKFCSATCMGLSYRFTPEKRRQAFLSKVRMGPGCWPWTGAVTSWGYGNFKAEEGYIGAHKAAWIYANGDVPDGLCVLHRCDNRVCCNPEHLFLGTKVDNAQDAVRKGRNWRGGNKVRHRSGARHFYRPEEIKP